MSEDAATTKKPFFSGLMLELVPEDVASLSGKLNAILDQRSECLLMCLEKSVQ